MRGRIGVAGGGQVSPRVGKQYEPAGRLATREIGNGVGNGGTGVGVRHRTSTVSVPFASSDVRCLTSRATEDARNGVRHRTSGCLGSIRAVRGAVSDTARVVMQKSRPGGRLSRSLRNNIPCSQSTSAGRAFTIRPKRRWPRRAIDAITDEARSPHSRVTGGTILRCQCRWTIVRWWISSGFVCLSDVCYSQECCSKEKHSHHGLRPP